MRNAALLVAAAACLPGCSAFVHYVWPCPQQVGSSRLTRETPDDAVDFLVDAFQKRRTGDIYRSLHPEFIEENGAFPESDFAVAYEKFEADFAADAASMAKAKRTVRDAVGGEVVVELSDESTGAFFPLALVDRPKIRLVTTNAYAPLIEGPVDMNALVRVENGRLKLPADFELTSIKYVSPQLAAALKSDEILRVEFVHDWLVRRIDVRAARGVRFVDKIKENVGK